MDIPAKKRKDTGSYYRLADIEPNSPSDNWTADNWTPDTKKKKLKPGTLLFITGICILLLLIGMVADINYNGWDASVAGKISPVPSYQQWTVTYIPGVYGEEPTLYNAELISEGTIIQTWQTLTLADPTTFTVYGETKANSNGQQVRVYKLRADLSRPDLGNASLEAVTDDAGIRAIVLSDPSCPRHAEFGGTTKL